MCYCILCFTEVRMSLKIFVCYCILYYREVRMTPRYSFVIVFCITGKCEWVQDIHVLLYSMLQGSANESKIFVCHCILCYREVRMSPRYSCVIVFCVTGKCEWVRDIRVSLYSVLQGSANESEIFVCYCILCYREVRMSPIYSCVIVFCVTGKWEWVQDICVLLYSVFHGSANESKIFVCYCILCFTEVRMSPRYSCVIVFCVTGKCEWVQDIRVLLYSVLQGSENESKIFVCSSRSQLIAKSDLNSVLKVTDIKVDSGLLLYVHACCPYKHAINHTNSEKKKLHQTKCRDTQLKKLIIKLT